MKNAKLLALKILTAVSTLLCATALAQTNPPQITSLIATQRAGTFFVDISYNLIDPDNQGAYILVECSSTGGSTYGVPIYSLTGDAGALVPPGNGKRIVWNAFNDWAGNYTTNARIRLVADASFKGVQQTTNIAPTTNLVWIPSGSFVMGYGPNVYISRGFWMGKFEVTQGEYKAIMTNNPSAKTNSLNLPVEQITWNQAVLYCQRLNTREQAGGRLPAGWSYRLPTEAEWEYACRAGTTTTYFFGNDSAANRLPFFAWHNFNSGDQTHDVGGRAPNRWGLYDMYGNVWEWCSDWFRSSLPSGNVTDPQGPSSGSANNIPAPRVVRGGAYNNGNDACRSPRREGGFNGFGDVGDQSSIYSIIGFRIVLAQNP